MKRYIDIFNNEFVTPGLNGFRTLDLRHPILTTKKIYTHFMSDSLYRNSIYLMLSTFIMAFFGFFFWIIVARLYTPEQVGIATTLISVLGLISGLSTLGLNVGLIRFLPKSVTKNEKINSSFTLTIIASILISVIFISGLKFFSPKLLFLQENFYYILSFVLFAIILSLNTIAESIFVAYRSAKYTLIKNSFMSIAKLILPLALFAFGAYGIFASVGIASTLAFILSIGLLNYFFKYQPRVTLNFQAIKTIASYSFRNYIIGFIGSLPTMLLPLIILNKLGAQEVAYFYLAMMIAGFIFIIPQATSQSLFSEGSNNDNIMNIHIKKVIIIIFFILIPTILITCIFGQYLLLAFGKKYSDQAMLLLQLLSISSIFISINFIYGTILRIKNKITELMLINMLDSLLILGLSNFLISKSLQGIGVAFLSGQAITSIIVFLLFIKNQNYKYE